VDLLGIVVGILGVGATLVGREPALVGIVVSILGVGATLAGVLVNRMNAREAALNAREATRRQEEATREATRRQEEATRRQEVGVDQWNRDLRNWASEAIDVLSEAVYASNSSDVRRYISQLSALIDRGRFFLPNQVNKEAEPEKLPAFQGRRHRALVPLIAALRVLDGDVENELKEYVSQKRSDVIRELQREFVSHIQLILDPRQRNREITQLIEGSDERVGAIFGVDGTGSRARLRDIVKRLEKD
jgi:hypothetical protein